MLHNVVLVRRRRQMVEQVDIVILGIQNYKTHTHIHTIIPSYDLD